MRLLPAWKRTRIYKIRICTVKIAIICFSSDTFKFVNDSPNMVPVKFFREPSSFSIIP